MTMSDTSSYLFVGNEVEPLCEQVKVISKNVNIESGEETVKMQVLSKSNGIPFNIPRYELVKRSLFHRLAQHGLNIIDNDDNYEVLRSSIIDSERQAPVVYFHQSVGFREIRGAQCFLGWKPIGSIPAKYLSSRNLEMQKMLESRGSFDAWKAFVRKHVVPNVELSLALMLGATGPVSYVLKEEGILPEVPLWSFTGKSSTGKSYQLVLTASLFANPKFFIGNLNATDNAIFALLQEKGGLPLLCDEFTLKAASNNVDSLIYDLANGMGKRRCNSRGELKPLIQFNGTVIFTSEISIHEASMQLDGQKCRIVEFNFNPFSKNPALAERIRSFCSTNFGWATEPLITLLLDPQWRERLIRDYNNTYDHLQQSVKFDVTGVERRLLQRCALILASGKLLRRAVQCNFDLNAVEQYLISHITKQLQTHDDRSQADIIVDKITNFVCANKEMFPVAASLEKSARNRHYGSWWGVTGFHGSNPCVWVQEQILKDRILPHEMKTANTTLQILHEKDYIVKFYDQRYCRKKDFGDIETTYYCILLPNAPSIFDKLDDKNAPQSMSVAKLNAHVLGVAHHDKILNAERDIPYLALGRAGNKSFSLYASKALCKGMAMSSRSTLYATPVPSEKVLLLTKERPAVNSIPLNFEKYNEGMVAMGTSVVNLQDKLAFQVPLDHRVVIQEIELEPYKDKPGAVVNYDEPYLSVEVADELPQDYSIKSIKDDGEARRRVLSLLEDDDDED